MLKIYLCILVLLVSTSCKGQRIRVNENETPLKKFPQVLSIEFKKIGGYPHPEPKEMHLKDNFIICNNSRTHEGGYWMNILTIQGELVDKKVKRGRGPDEILSAGSSGFYNDLFWVFDSGLGRLWFMKNFLEGELYLKSYATDLNVLLARYLNHSSLITFGSTGTKNKYDVYDFKANRIIKGYGNFNTLSKYTVLEHSNKEEWNPQPEKLFFEGDFKVKPDRTKFVASCYYIDAIEIYNIDGTLVKCLRGPLNLNPDFKVFKTEEYAGVDRPPHTKVGYTYISCSDEYIYAGFSGKQIIENSPFHFEKIYVFNWEGESIAILYLNHPTGSFVIDEKEKTIYAVSGRSGDLIKASFSIDESAR